MLSSEIFIFLLNRDYVAARSARFDRCAAIGANGKIG